MYRTQQIKELQEVKTLSEEVKYLAQQHQEQIRLDLEEQHLKLKCKAQKKLPRIINHALSKIKKAAKNGEYHLRYRYNPWYRFWDSFDLDNNHWNDYTRDSLKKKLEEMGFRCGYDCKKLSISWN